MTFVSNLKGSNVSRFTFPNSFSLLILKTSIAHVNCGALKKYFMVCFPVLQRRLSFLKKGDFQSVRKLIPQNFLVQVYTFTDQVFLIRTFFTFALGPMFS